MNVLRRVGLLASYRCSVVLDEEKT